MIKKQHNQQLYEIYWGGGGEVPDSLKGSFTSYKDAEISLNIWEAAKIARIPKVKIRKKVTDAKSGSK